MIMNSLLVNYLLINLIIEKIKLYYFQGSELDNVKEEKYLVKFIYNYVIWLSKMIGVAKEAEQHEYIYDYVIWLSKMIGVAKEAEQHEGEELIREEQYTKIETNKECYDVLSLLCRL